MYINPQNVLKRYVKMGFEKPMSSKTYLVGGNKSFSLFNQNCAIKYIFILTGCSPTYHEVNWPLVKM